MEQFLVSARKYRPTCFEFLIGQQNIATTLKNSIIRGQLAHAYLFCGPRGVGKTTTARIFAKLINCFEPAESMEPCGKCESCISFDGGRSYSIHELDAASNNSVDDIRNLTEIVRIPPQVGKYSVYIIDEVHMLSSAAFNAFLKTLEEPPEHAIFILATTEKHKILPTILSRCQTYDFNRISINDIASNISEIASKEGVNIDSNAIHIIAQKADGAMRDALTLFDQTIAFCGKEITYEQVVKNLNVLEYEYYFKIIEHSLESDYISSFLIFDELLSKGFNALHFVSGLSSHLRDLIICKNNAADTLLSLPPSIISRYKEQAQKCSVPFLFKALNLTTTCEAGYKQSGNQRLLIEFTLMKISLEMSQTLEKPQVKEPIKPQEIEVKKVEPKVEVPQAPIETPIEVPQQKAQPEESTPQQIEKLAEPIAVPTPAVALPKGVGLSIKDMMLKAQEATANQSRVEEVKEDIPFEEEKFLEVWSELVDEQENTGKKVLASTLRQYTPEIDTENACAIFYVSNSAQKTWVEDKCLVKMVAFVREKMGNKKANLQVEIIPDTDEDGKKKLYMPVEKAKFMLAKSDELRELKKDLDLDIK